MQANQPQGGDAKASTATSATRTRPAMASKRLDLPSTCDICGNARDALLSPRQQPKPGRRHPWNRSQQQVQP
ncbi:TPA: hypothetical protein ACUT84_003675 [Pseudomonas aeruginosa]